MTFPARDAEIAQKLAADLVTSLTDLCRLPDANCPTDFRLDLTLETDEAQLLALGQDFRAIFPRRSGGNTLLLSLPTPTLVGRPMDEAGYHALLNGYAGWVTAVLFFEFNRTQQPDYQTISQALSQIDLRPPPLLRERPWQAQIPPPIPLPQQDILTACQGGQALTILRYDLAQSAWMDETAAFPDDLAPSTWGLLFPMLGGDGAALLLNRNDPIDQLYLWRNGTAALLLDDVPGDYWLPSAYVLPAGEDEYVLAFYQQDTTDSGQMGFDILDLTTCPGPDCQLQNWDRLKYTAPGGDHMLLQSVSNFELSILSLGDGEGQILQAIGPGWSPIWLDETTFIYIRPDPMQDLGIFLDNGGETEVVLTDSSNPASAEIVLSSQALRDALPESGRPAHLLILSLIHHPTQSDLWIVQTMTFDTAVPRQDDWFTVNQRTGEIELLLELDNAQGFPARIEGNGRYLAVMGLESSGSPVYYVHDLERQQTRTYSAAFISPDGIDWSADGRWFILPDEGMLRLVAPGSRYERPLFHGQAQCGTAVWVNR